MGHVANANRIMVKRYLVLSKYGSVMEMLDSLTGRAAVLLQTFRSLLSVFPCQCRDSHFRQDTTYGRIHTL
jgi:anthranilate/para-aminobenzoate synthase component I